MAGLSSTVCQWSKFAIKLFTIGENYQFFSLVSCFHVTVKSSSALKSYMEAGSYFHRTETYLTNSIQSLGMLLAWVSLYSFDWKAMAMAGFKVLSIYGVQGVPLVGPIKRGGTPESCARRNMTLNYHPGLSEICQLCSWEHHLVDLTSSVLLLLTCGPRSTPWPPGHQRTPLH